MSNTNKVIKQEQNTAFINDNPNVNNVSSETVDDVESDSSIINSLLGKLNELCDFDNFVNCHNNFIYFTQIKSVNRRNEILSRRFIITRMVSQLLDLYLTESEDDTFCQRKYKLPFKKDFNSYLNWFKGFLQKNTIFDNIVLL